MKSFPSTMKIWYDNPMPGWQTARQRWKPSGHFNASLDNPWFQALPVGNGRLGGMVFGGIGVERIQLNEETLRSGGPVNRCHPRALALLPALPPSWPDGRISGLRARGGFEVDLAWRGGRLTDATIRSRLGTRCTLKTGEPVAVLRGGKTIPVEALTPDTVAFVTEPGAEFEIVSREPQIRERKFI